MSTSLLVVVTFFRRVLSACNAASFASSFFFSASSFFLSSFCVFCNATRLASAVSASVFAVLAAVTAASCFVFARLARRRISARRVASLCPAAAELLRFVMTPCWRRMTMSASAIDPETPEFEVSTSMVNVRSPSPPVSNALRARPPTSVRAFAWSARFVARAVREASSSALATS